MSENTFKQGEAAIASLRETVELLKTVSAVMADAALQVNENTIKLSEIKEQTERVTAILTNCHMLIKYSEASEELARANKHIQNAVEAIKSLDQKENA